MVLIHGLVVESLRSMSDLTSYQPQYPAQSLHVEVRGLRYHLLCWGDVSKATPKQPLLVMVHGWMDVAASFQFMVDQLRQQPGWVDRPIVAIDWRGFGGTTPPPGTDCYFLRITWAIWMPCWITCRPGSRWICWVTAWAVTW